MPRSGSEPTIPSTIYSATMVAPIILYIYSKTAVKDEYILKLGVFKKEFNFENYN